MPDVMQVIQILVIPLVALTYWNLRESSKEQLSAIKELLAQQQSSFSGATDMLSTRIQAVEKHMTTLEITMTRDYARNEAVERVISKIDGLNAVLIRMEKHAAEVQLSITKDMAECREDCGGAAKRRS